jgi:hypothetical protein
MLLGVLRSLERAPAMVAEDVAVCRQFGRKRPILYDGAIAVVTPDLEDGRVTCVGRKKKGSIGQVQLFCVAQCRCHFARTNRCRRFHSRP